MVTPAEAGRLGHIMGLLVFTVPPFQYLVNLTAGRPIAADGREVAALIDTNEGMIYAWAGLSVPGLENALRHEVWHGWEYHYAADDAGEERRAQMFANASQHFDAELSVQGGRDRLAKLRDAAMRPAEGADADLPVIQLNEELAEQVATDDPRELHLEPAGSDSITPGEKWGSAHRRDCPSCGSYVWGGSIITLGEPYYLDLIDGRPVEGWVVNRACVCGTCDVMAEWIEGVGPDGRPNCVPVAEPVQTTRRTKEGAKKIRDFLRHHPKANPTMLTY